jgi:predicted secreted protein
MSVTGAAVLFVVIWFMTMFVVLPIRARSQADAGDVVPGTPEGAPAEFRLGRTMLIVTLWTIPLWGIVVAIIVTGMISVESLDWMGVLGERVPN